MTGNRLPLTFEAVARDPIIGPDTTAFSPSRARPRSDDDDEMAGPSTQRVSEDTPLLPRNDGQSGNGVKRKPFYRARPMWLAPFAITAACVRGMTLAPRVEVFTQLACSKLHHDPYQHSSDPVDPTSYLYQSSEPNLSPPVTFIPIYVDSDTQPDGNDTDDDGDPREVPSSRCMQDTEVQATAARIQTVMTTTMGILSALTTGWWGHFGERHGRVKVLALSTFGLVLTDLIFILVSMPSLRLSKHGDKLLIIAPIIEGLLGGWTTLQSATSAYVSDCTSPGSRSNIFSRFTGAFFIGICVGPSIGGWIIHNYSTATHKSVTEVFYYSAFASTVNLVLCLLLFPESLSQEKQEKARILYARETSKKGKGRATDDGEDGDKRLGFVGRFLSPLKMFLPAIVPDASGTKTKKDWSLTLLAGTLFGYFLSTGIYQLKYLYAAHTYGWGPDELSYYVSFMGGSRALFLLLILPAIIKGFKPSVKKVPGKGKGKTSTAPKVTLNMLSREIHFDLMLTKISLFVDILSDVLIVAFPVPAYKVNQLNIFSSSKGTSLASLSEGLFVISSSLSGFGSGVVPAVQSLALCILQARELANGEVNGEGEPDANTGKLFGALAVMQAAGQMIVGPLLFGLIYSETVGVYPKAVFVTAGSILFLSLVAVLFVRNPVKRRPTSKKRRQLVLQDDEEDVERGRSRVSKDLFGGAMSDTPSQR